MPRRYGRMFLRGKPGLFILVSIIGIGLFLAYYTLGGSSTKSSKYSMYKKLQRPGKFPSYQVQKDNKGFSDQVFRKNIRMNQLPRPVQPPADWSARRNFGGMKNNYHEMPRNERHDSDEDYADNKEMTNSKFKLYTEVDETMMPLFQKLQRLVHLDLKGAPPKIEYLEKILPLLTKLGATGLLIEYEDMFPYTGELSMLAAENAYSTKDISRLLLACKNNNLEVIPLVQTFGHMEFVLKYPEYQHLREHESMPQVISPLFDESYTLISKMVQQILAVHPDVEYLHIGSDEVYGLGQGKTHELIAKGKEQVEIFLEHVVKVANLVKSIRQSIHLIMWDDELRQVHENLIERSGLHKLVEPMVWMYIPNPRDQLPEDLWVKYGKLFPNVWTASSFKGATGSAEFYTNVSYHLQNHLSWVDIIKNLKDEMPKLKGMALTGWQRYDHFATLCELLPEALPSLAVCLETLRNGGFSERIHRSASKLLNCTNLIELEMPQVSADGGVLVSQDCSFPGRDFYYSTQQLWGVLNMFRKDNWLKSVLHGWLTDYHIKHQFGSIWHLKQLVDKLGKIITNLSSLVAPVSNSLNDIYDNYTITEWIEVNLKQRINRLKETSLKADLLLQKKTWPKRPLHDVPVDHQTGVRNQMGMAGQGSQMGMAGQGSQIGMAGKGSQMGMAGKGSQMGMAGKGPQMGMAGKGPQMGMAGKGPQMGMAGKGPQMGMAGQGSQMGMAGKGSQMGMAGQGSQMGMAGKGSQMGMAGKGSQMGMAGKGSQLGMAGKGSQMGMGRIDLPLNRQMQPFNQFNGNQLTGGSQNDPRSQQILYNSLKQQNMAVMNRNLPQSPYNLRRQPATDGSAVLQSVDRKASLNDNRGKGQDSKKYVIDSMKNGNAKYPAEVNERSKGVGNSFKDREQVHVDGKYPSMGNQRGGVERQNVLKYSENGPRKMEWEGKDDKVVSRDKNLKAQITETSKDKQ